MEWDMVCYSVFYNFQDIQEPDIDWDVATDFRQDGDGVVGVPKIDCSLNDQLLEEMQMLLHENGDTDSRNLYLLCR